MMDDIKAGLKRRARQYVVGLVVGVVAMGAKLALRSGAGTAEAAPAAPAASPAGAVGGASARTAASVAVAPAEGAQVPSIATTSVTKAPQAPMRVAAATDARTEAMTRPDGEAPGAPPAAPARGGAVAVPPATPAAPTPAPTPAPTAAAAPAPVRPAAADSVQRRDTRSIAVNVAGAGSEATGGELVLMRETYAYAPRGRRDPFLSLMTTGELRPMIADLLLVGVAYDQYGRNSVAIMRDVTTKEQYRVRVGQGIGRMRVARIQPKQVVFTIEEFGFSRQEVLVLGDSTKARAK
jgi:hypothetical protein